MKTIVTIFLSLLIFCFTDSKSQDISGTFALKNVKTGIYVRIKDANSKDGTPIVAYSPVEWKCVTWDFKKQTDNSYQLINLFSHKTMASRFEAKENVVLEEQPINGGNNNQKFDFILAGKGIYLIKLSGTDLYLSPSDSAGKINAPIILKKRDDSKLQYWQLVAQNPKI